MATRARRGLAVLVLAAYSFAFACGPAAAATSSSTTSTSSSTTSKSSSSASSAKWIGVAQTVVVGTSPTGKISGKPEVFTQFSANGSGPATLKVPMSPSGFRNLSGLGKAPIEGGYAVWNLNLNGVTHERSVAHFPTAKLPLQVTVAFELNGKKIKAQDIVGKTGELKVTYVIHNVTTKPTKVTFKNVFGDEETTTVNTPVPIAAIVDVTIPATFTNLKLPGASASGNGNGTSAASWTLLMFDPLGGVKQSVTWQAHVTNAVLPSATVEGAVLPPANVKPLPQIKEPGAPAVPTVDLGANLAKIQRVLQGARAQLRAKAVAALNAFKQVAVPAVRGVSRNAATVAGNLPLASAAAQTASLNALHTATLLSQASFGAADASTRAADLHTRLDQASAEAADASTRAVALHADITQAAVEAADASARAADIHASLNQSVAEAADAVTRVADIRTGLEALPDLVKLTPAYRAVHAKVVDVERRLIAHEARLTATAGAAGLVEVHLVAHTDRLRLAAARADVERVRLIGHAARLRVTAARATVLGVKLTVLSDLLTAASSLQANVVAPAAHTASTKLIALVPTANALSVKAGKTATTIAHAVLSPTKDSKAIQPKEVGGGAKLDSAVGQLDSAITQSGEKIDSAYAYLTALNKRAFDNQLPAGDAQGSTAEAGAFVYSVQGANNSTHQTQLSAFIAEMALFIGLPFGIAFYRIRRGMPSSLKPPAAAKG